MTSVLTITTREINSANLGIPSILPDIKPNYPAEPIKVTVAEGLTAEEGAWVGCGNIHSILPYTIQDGYDRNLKLRPMNIAVLENEYLRAEFSCDLGGRLWSLYSKKDKRELFLNNKVFQPANLALRNAWFSGGVEWNIGIIGHHPYTCSPMFIARYKNKEGGDVLKMYEYERKRGIAYCVRATLKDDMLLVRVTIENLSGRDSYVYWWSNCAVVETPKSRMIVPAKTYYHYEFKDDATHVTTPDIPLEGTYPANHDRSIDYFYKTEEGRRPFMSYYDGEGRGLAQISTRELIGRKLFVWGTKNAGGRNWNNWLQRDDSLYAEIQAGLLHSQMEQRPMPAGEIIEWTEGYISSELDKDMIHNDDYALAGRYVEKNLTENGRFAAVDNSDSYFAADGEEEIVLEGSAWGALEEISREADGLSAADARISRHLTFPRGNIKNRPEGEFAGLFDGSGLLTHGTDISDAGEDYFEYAMGERFIKALENIAEKDWYVWLQLACAYYEAGRFDSAKDSFRKSIAEKENFVALRSLAWMLAADYAVTKDSAAIEEGIALMLRAAELGGAYKRLISDAVTYMRTFASPENVVDLIERSGVDLNKGVASGRIKLFYAQNLAKVGRYTDAAEILTSAPELSDVREGELSTTSIWLEVFRGVIAEKESRAMDSITDAEVFEKHPIPTEMDFRMS